MRLLFWKIGALGDVLMTTPLVRQVRQAFPTAQIDYLTGSTCVSVLEGNAHLDRVIGFDESILFRARVAQLGAVLRLLRGYDAVFVLDKHWIFSALARAARVPQRIGFSRKRHEGLFHTHKVAYGPLRHEIHYYLDLAEAFGLPVNRADVALELPGGTPYPLPAPYVVLVNSGGANAGESSNVRRMPDTLFRALVDHFEADGKIVFLGAAGEIGQYGPFAGPSTINLCGRTSLPQAWHILAHARAVYATDSGLMHMAAAVNPNVVAVFGPTHPARKCPPGARWVWTDQPAYDDRYELFGAVPRREYFRDMTLANILEARAASSL